MLRTLQVERRWSSRIFSRSQMLVLYSSTRRSLMGTHNRQMHSQGGAQRFHGRTLTRHISPFQKAGSIMNDHRYARCSEHSPVSRLGADRSVSAWWLPCTVLKIGAILGHGVLPTPLNIWGWIMNESQLIIDNSRVKEPQIYFEHYCPLHCWWRSWRLVFGHYLLTASGAYR